LAAESVPHARDSQGGRQGDHQDCLCGTRCWD